MKRNRGYPVVRFCESALVPIQEATKTEDGTEYPASAYLVVPDKDQPSTWKLRIKELADGAVTVTRAQLGRALAALFKGFRGNRVQLAADERMAAITKLRAEYRKLGVKGEDLPAELREAGFPEMLIVSFLADDDAFSEALSLYDLNEQVVCAFKAKFVSGDNPPYLHEITVYPDFVVCKQEGKMLRVGYRLEGGNVMFGSDTLEQVEIDFKSASASSERRQNENLEATEETHAALLEAMADTQGWVWDVTITRAGRTQERTLSNGTKFVRDYPIQVLETAKDLFNGVEVFAFSEKEHADSVDRKGTRDAVGYVKEAATNGSELRGHLHLYKDAIWLRDRWMGLRESGELSRAGLSIDSAGTGRWLKDGDLAVQEVTAIKKVHSVEVVHRPAAGGQVNRMVASATEEVTMKLEDILQLIESARPELLKDVDRAKITEKEAEVMLREAMKTPDPGKDKPVARDAPIPNPPPDYGELRETVSALTASLQAFETTRMLDARLAESTLPERVKTKLRKQFAGGPCDATRLNEAIQEEQDTLRAILAEAGARVPKAYGGVTITKDEQEVVQRRLEAMLWGGAMDDQNPNRPDYLKGVKPFRSIREAYKAVTGEMDPDAQLIFAETALAIPYSSNERVMEAMRYRLTESVTTSSWTELLGDSVRRRMLAEYNLPNLQDWRKVVSDLTSVPDFRTNRRMRMGGYGTLSTVSEQGTYPELTSVTDEEETYAVSKKGGLDDLTFETIKNDDVGAVRRIPIKLGRAAGQTLYRDVFDVIEDNDTLADGVALVATATHANLISGVLANDTVSEGRRLMMDQAAYGDTSEVLGMANIPRWLIVPNELDEVSWQLTRGWPLGQGEHDTADRNANFHSSYGLSPLIVPYFAVATDYWLVADPGNIPTIEVGFLDGRQEPEVFVQDQPNVGSVFTADKITYKVRFIYGTIALDYRGFAGYIA